MPSIEFIVARMQSLPRDQRAGYLQELIGERTNDKTLLHQRALLVTALRDAKLGIWLD